MTVGEALHRASQTLAEHSFEDADLEAEVLLMHTLGVERARLYVLLTEELSVLDAEAFTGFINRRLCHEPIAYIVGHREFFGFDLYVAPGVLIPRPETELLVEETIRFASERFPNGDPVVADIGTGSGAVAIAVALHLPQATVYATDVSSQALEIARMNCERHSVQSRVNILQGDLLEPLPGPVDIVVANLPYVGDAEFEGLSPEVRLFEPSLALAGGGDGLDRVRQLLGAAWEKLRPGGAVVIEVGCIGEGGIAQLERYLPPAASTERVSDAASRIAVLKIEA
ncbi:MAG: peptide chain release factor N(5)-glutamine methyltransferase [Chloroflexota bacterium]|nr:peptide chain release factor N(5)-glutamine methyltransferase [Chloroflexota bacterium]